MKAKKLLAVVLAAVLLASVFAVNAFAAVTISKDPTKKEYAVGDKFNPAGMRLKDGSKTISYGTSTKKDFAFEPDLDTPLTLADTAVKVYYKGDYIGDIEISVYGLIQAPAKTAYNPGDFFDPTGLKISYGGEEISYTAGNALFAFTPSLTTALKSSNKQVAIKYNNKTITILAITVNGVDSYPTKTSYTVGEKIDAAGLSVSYNGGTYTYPNAGFTFAPSADTVLTLGVTEVAVYFDGVQLGKYNITVEGLINGPTAEFAREGKKLDPNGLATKFNGVTVNYADDPANFSFSPSIETPIELKKDVDGNILPVNYTVYYKGYEVGSFEKAVNHDFGDFVQLESGKEHAKICKQCGELVDLEKCENSVHNFKANDDAGFFKLQTETGTCDKCGGTVTRNIEGTNKLDSIFDYVHEDGMAATELTILTYFKLILVSLIQMIIPV